MNVKLITYTPNPEHIVAAAARVCYSKACIGDLLDEPNPEADARFVRKLAGMGHDSPTEHASFTFGIEGISRACLAQLTRHRIASYSVQSQRYVSMRDFRFVIPPEIEADPEARQIFLDTMQEDSRAYLQVSNALRERHKAAFLEQGMSEREAERKAEKLANEDARHLLPNACETKLVMTMNARSLQNFFRLRCCNRAQWEIRELAERMLRLVYPVAPALFENAGPACVVTGQCPEGAMSCGMAQKMRRKYQVLKEVVNE